MYTLRGSPYRLIWVSIAPVLASPKTFFRVRSSRIHFSSTVGEKWMLDERTPKDVCRVAISVLALGSVNGKTFLAPSCLTRDQRKPIFQAGNIEEEGWRWSNLLPGSQSFFLNNMKWDGESPRTKEQEAYQHTHVLLVHQNDDSTSRLSSDQAKTEFEE